MGLPGFCLVCFLFLFSCFVFCLVCPSFVCTPDWMLDCVMVRALFDSPMRDADILCIIRSLAQILCYDLARAEKAKDGKKNENGPAWRCLFFECRDAFLASSGIQNEIKTCCGTSAGRIKNRSVWGARFWLCCIYCPRRAGRASVSCNHQQSSNATEEAPPRGSRKRCSRKCWNAKELSDCGHATSLVAFRDLGHSAGNLKPLKDCPLFTALRAFRHTQHVRNTHAT